MGEGREERWGGGAGEEGGEEGLGGRRGGVGTWVERGGGGVGRWGWEEVSWLGEWR